MFDQEEQYERNRCFAEDYHSVDNTEQLREDATDPLIPALATIGELAGWYVVDCICDIFDDEVDNFSRDRVSYMLDDFAAYRREYEAKRKAGAA